VKFFVISCTGWLGDNTRTGITGGMVLRCMVETAKINDLVP